MIEGYSQKAVFLKNVASTDSFYLPKSTSKTQSMVFAPESVGTDQTPVALTELEAVCLGTLVM